MWPDKRLSVSQFDALVDGYTKYGVENVKKKLQDIVTSTSSGGKSWMPGFCVCWLCADCHCVRGAEAHIERKRNNAGLYYEAPIHIEYFGEDKDSEEGQPEEEGQEKGQGSTQHTPIRSRCVLCVCVCVCV